MTTSSATEARSSPRGGFTLIELLIVIAVIGILLVLALPALQGLTGVSGKMGGINSFVSALDQARFAAVESGVTAYVFFPPGNYPDNLTNLAKHNSFIVARERTEEEGSRDLSALICDGAGLVFLGKWRQLPKGSLYELGDVPTIFSGANFPPLPGPVTDGIYRVIRFDKFGRAMDRGAVRVGDGVFNGSSVTFKGTDNKGYANINIGRLRVAVTDP